MVCERMRRGWIGVLARGEVQAGGEGRRWVCAEIKRGHIMLKKKKKQDKVNPFKFYHILHGEVRKSF